MSRDGNETKIEDRSATITVGEKQALLKRLHEAETSLEKAREKNAELQAINDAYAKRLDVLVPAQKLTKLSQEIFKESEDEFEEVPVTRPAKKAKSESDEDYEEVPRPKKAESDEQPKEDAKVKRCGKCKKTGHNARTCKA